MRDKLPPSETYDPLGRSAGVLREDPRRAEREVDSRVKWGMTVEVIFEALEK